MPVHRNEHILILCPDEFAVVLRASIQIRTFCDKDSDDEEDGAVERSRAFSVYAVFSAGPVSEDNTRRRVRIAMYVAPAPEDLGDATNTGLCIDDGNEVDLERGVPNTIKFRETNGRNTGGSSGTRLLFPPVTWFVEWGGAFDEPSILFSPTFDMPLATMNVVEHHQSTFCVHEYRDALRNCSGCLPSIPEPRPTKAPATVTVTPPFERAVSNAVGEANMPEPKVAAGNVILL